jgi:hypothetical protein
LLLTGLMTALRRLDDSHRQHQYLEELRTDSTSRRTNHPARGKAGIPPQFTIEHTWPGLPEKV